MDYGYSRRLDSSPEKLEEELSGKLKQKRFGMVSDIDMAEKFRMRLMRTSATNV